MRSFGVFVFLLFAAVVVADPVQDAKRREQLYTYVFLFVSCNCTRDMSPICGTDGFSYPNVCYFNELKDYWNRDVPSEQAYVGFCGNEKDALIIEAMEMVKTSRQAIYEGLKYAEPQRIFYNRILKKLDV